MSRKTVIGKGITFIQFANHFGIQDFDVYDGKGRTMMHQAASHDDTQVCKQLLKKGANANIQDQYNFTPYGLALREEKFEVAKYLLEVCPPASVKQGAGTFGTLLHLATAKL